MKTQQKSLISPTSGFIWAKSRQLFYTASLLAIVLGIFLLPKTAFMASINPEKIISLTNKERTSAGLNVLHINKQLTQAAEAKAQAILNSQTFDHTIDGKKFSSWIKVTGYQYKLVGENLAIDFVTDEGLMRAWMNSPEHRENILEKDYTEIGIGIAEGKFDGQNTIVVAQLFGDPIIKAAPIPASIAKLDEHISAHLETAAASAGYLAFYRSLICHLSLVAEQRTAAFL
jgi:hypothetical protein